MALCALDGVALKVQKLLRREDVSPQPDLARCFLSQER